MRAEYKTGLKQNGLAASTLGLGKLRLVFMPPRWPFELMGSNRKSWEDLESPWKSKPLCLWISKQAIGLLRTSNDLRMLPLNSKARLPGMIVSA
jgi:hypothetical protein